MARTDAAESLNLDIYRQLRADIITGHYPPGSRIGSNEVRQRFAVSTGVVREAMARLEVHGLVRVEPNRGFYVPSLSAKQLRDLTDARVLNETAALRAAIRLGDVDWETRVLAAHHKMARLPANEQVVSPRDITMVDAHLDFHMELLSACDNDVLLDICRRLQDTAELYRSWAVEEYVKQGRRDGRAEEHRRILDATLARDEKEAVAVYEHHLRFTASVILAGSEEQGNIDSLTEN
jgi:DNA-binding GntR family transcriptional regulator